MQFKENETIFSQIERYVKRRIFTGAYRPGERLLAIREFAVFMKVNPNTIVKVYANLEKEGLVVSERTNGKFVTDDIKQIENAKADFIQSEVRAFLKSIKTMTADEQEIIRHIKEHYEDV